MKRKDKIMQKLTVSLSLMIILVTTTITIAEVFKIGMTENQVSFLLKKNSVKYSNNVLSADKNIYIYPTMWNNTNSRKGLIIKQGFLFQIWYSFDTTNYSDTQVNTLYQKLSDEIGIDSGEPIESPQENIKRNRQRGVSYCGDPGQVLLIYDK